MDFEKLESFLQNNTKAVVQSIYPLGHINGNEYELGDIYGSKGKSFKINLNTAKWAEFNGGGVSGCGLIDLYAKKNRIEYKEAAESLARLFGYDDGSIVKPKSNPTKDEDKVYIVPFDAPPPPTSVYNAELKKNFDITKMWEIRTFKGDLVAYDCRVDYPDGHKDVLPLRWVKDSWMFKAIKDKRPPYGIHQLNGNYVSPIVITEGCKCADAAKQLLPAYLSITWTGGSNAVKKTDWSKVADRKVVIIPDADAKHNKETGELLPWNEQPGMKAALQIAKILYDNRCEVKIINTESQASVKDGWDIADALAEGWKASDMLKFCRDNATVYPPASEIELNELDDVYIEVKDSSIKEREDSADDNKYFRILGYNRDIYFYYQKKSGQIFQLRARDHDKKTLISLAPFSWWESTDYKTKSGVDWDGIIDFMFRACERKGVFDPNMMRGRGAWIDIYEGKKRFVLHAGDHIIANGVRLPVDKLESKYIYQLSTSLGATTSTILPSVESRKLIDLCCKPRWEKQVYGKLLAGWLFSSLICGSLPFRSHLYIIGKAGSGKTWIKDNIIKPVLGNVALYCGSKTTEPGLRRMIGCDARPIIFDEAEGENEQDRKRMQEIFDLARQASSESNDVIIKGGTTNGEAFLCRSAFCFSSINNTMTKAADESRTSVLRLLPPVGDKAAPKAKEFDLKNFQAMESFAAELLTDEYCQCLLTRAVNMIDVVRANHKTFSDAGGAVFGSKRIGDQLAMMLAGLYGLLTNNLVSKEQAERWIKQEVILDLVSEQTVESDDEELIDKISFANIPVEDGTRILRKKQVGWLIDLVNIGNANDNISPTAADEALRLAGLMLKDEKVYISNKSPLLDTLLSGTTWEKKWSDALSRIPGAEKTKAVYFMPHIVSRAVAIPLDKFIVPNINVS